MEFNDYQNQIKNYANFNVELGPYITGLNCATNTGKLTEILSTILNSKSGITQKDIAKLELVLGDLLFWITTTASTLGIELDEVAVMNIRKNFLIHQKEIESTKKINAHETL